MSERMTSKEKSSKFIFIFLINSRDAEDKLANEELSLAQEKKLNKEKG